MINRIVMSVKDEMRMGQIMYFSGKEHGFICKKCLKVVGFVSPTTGKCWKCYNEKHRIKDNEEMKLILEEQRKRTWEMILGLKHSIVIG